MDRDLLTIAVCVGGNVRWMYSVSVDVDRRSTMLILHAPGRKEHPHPVVVAQTATDGRLQ